jgi:hypothetical protein
LKERGCVADQPQRVRQVKIQAQHKAAAGLRHSRAPAQWLVLVPSGGRFVFNGKFALSIPWLSA